jgi:hypothetical protein
MSDDVFYVGALDDNHQLSGFVPARFMTINGQPVADQTPGGPSGYIPYIYSDAQGSNKSDEANPNNYMIVPAGFNEAHARAYADQIRQTMNNPEGGVPFVLTKMFFDFWRGGSQDLQRGSQWGIPEGSTVPAFASGASHYLGFVSGLTGLPLTLSHMGGGLLNLHGVDRSGPWGVSQQNDKNLMQGWSDATATPPPSWIAGTGAGFPDQPPIGQIGGGGKAGWISTLQGIDPANPTQPTPPQKPRPLGLVSNQPMPDWPIPPPISNTER